MRKVKPFFNNWLHILLVFGGVFLFNAVVQGWYLRWDLTAEKRFTLSSNSQELLSELQDSVQVAVYLEGDLNPGFSRLREATRDMLFEMRFINKDYFSFQFINPHEGSSSQKKALFKKLEEQGIVPINIHETGPEGKRIQKLVFPWALIRKGDRIIPIRLLKNISGKSGESNLNYSIENLEYELMQGLRILQEKKLRKIAFLEGHGELAEGEVYDITTALSQFFQVDRGRLGADPHVLDPYEAVIIAGPRKPFSEADKFILDQYVMKGGRLLWFLDAIDISKDSLSFHEATMGLYRDLNLDDMLFVYGVRVNPELLTDMQAGVIPVNVSRDPQKTDYKPAPWIYDPLLIPAGQHPVARYLSPVKGSFVNTIDTVGKNSAVRKTVLLHSSSRASVQKPPIYVSLATVFEDPDPQFFTQSRVSAAVLMEGRFKSVFENRLPPREIPQHLEILTLSKSTRMLVVGDGDIIRNEVRGVPPQQRIIPLGYDPLTRQTYGNKEFILNVVNYLCDDGGWMELRNRTFRLRLLDRAKVQQSIGWIKWVNVLLPLVIIGILGGFFSLWRRWRFQRDKKN